MTDLSDVNPDFALWLSKLPVPAALAQPVQQLVARIKRSSKYAYQAPKGGWFDVRVVPDTGYGLRGNNNNYRFGDVVFGVRLDDGTIVELK